ncbi:leucine-rich repeat-containing G-protein coupled receptor 5-like [Boleophthalmus pectinirostris]|uniref:leucine-rich repeat-containing G-protein coupled receptor 5-like n=1 Tax=Boleophthalmus pectinirostris TaxID=150288 RepID=UPI002430BB12|nr:leucine-rich repeat-containing G-protein coupled receptor 5-like [Boleophthalmus pectinirostris]
MGPSKMVLVLVLVPLWPRVCSAPWTGLCPDMCRCDTKDEKDLTVNCVERGLSKVPANLSQFTTILDLSMNVVKELPERAFGQMCSLRELRLAGNRLQQIHSEAFSGLHTLTTLTLHDTGLKTVPSEALNELKNLQSLCLDANRLSAVPSLSFRGLSSLRLLRLEDNHLEQTPGGALAHVPRLQALSLGMNRLKVLSPRSFHRLTELLLLQLQHNQIHSLSPTCFYGLHQLQTLDLSFNRLHSFPSAFQLLTSLQRLNLQNNWINFIPENALRGNPSLKKLILLNNPLFVVGRISKLSKLPSLGFSEISQKNPEPFHQLSNYNTQESCETQDSFWVLSLLLFITLFLTAGILTRTILFKLKIK